MSKTPKFTKEEENMLEAGHEVEKENTPTESTESTSKTHGTGHCREPKKLTKTGKTMKCCNSAMLFIQNKFRKR